MGRNEQYAVMIALISAALGAVFYLGSLDHHVKSNTNAITSLGSKIDSLAQFLRDDVRENRSFYIPLATKFKILERKEEIKQDSENQSVKQKS